MLIPHQVNKNAKRAIAQANVQAAYNVYQSPVLPQPAVVSAKPALYTSPKAPVQQPTSSSNNTSSNVDFGVLKSEVEKKLKKLKNEKVSAELAISQGNTVRCFVTNYFKLNFIIYSR